ncbi:hypothetical protein ACWOBK_09395 [Facklamia miroungae]|nr:hypothetical protein [Facklamia miroungae]NKZ30222.1 hypothetical protein [Facklamia miroungae]
MAVSMPISAENKDKEAIPAKIQTSLKKEKKEPAKAGAMTEQLIKDGNSEVTQYDKDNKDYQNQEPVIPASYIDAMHTKGKDLGKQPNTIESNGIIIEFVPLKENTGSQEDFDQVNEVLSWDGVPQVGMNGIRTFFGHYYDNNNTGAFAPFASRNYFEPGNEFIVTDEDGISKAYEITAIIPVQTDFQYNYFYNEDSIPFLAYYGNGDDMAAFMTCRWDKAIGQMDFAIAYRIW